MTEVAVVILNFNGAHFLRQFLPSVILHSQQQAKIIVADNCSTDDSVNILRSEFPAIEVIELTENYGYAGGYNQALSQIEAEYFLLLNSDVEVTKEWLTPLIGFLDTNLDYIAVQPKILDYNKRDHFEYAGAAGGFIDSLGYPYCRGRIFETIEIDSGQYDIPIDVFWCSGACFMIRSKAFRDVGGFDADFFAHMEEIDLCWRMVNLGHKMACIPGSQVYHVGGGTLNKTSPNKTYLNFRNNLIMLTKNLTLGYLLICLVTRAPLDFLAAIKLSISNGSKHFIAVLRAYVSYVSQLKRTLSKRKYLDKKEIPSAFRIVLIDYHLKGKKTYHNL